MKQNPNYEASAVNLTNPAEIPGYLENLHSARLELDGVLTAIENSVPAVLREKRNFLEQGIEKLVADIKVVIDTKGSYQDTERGFYALKQKRETIIYNPVFTRNALDSKYAGLVIVEAVDSKALEGLVKGGLVTQEQVKQCGEVKATYAYIVK